MHPGPTMVTGLKERGRGNTHTLRPGVTWRPAELSTEIKPWIGQETAYTKERQLNVERFICYGVAGSLFFQDRLVISRTFLVNIRRRLTTGRIGVVYGLSMAKFATDIDVGA